MYLIVNLFYLYTPLNLLCKEMRCLNKIIIIIINRWLMYATTTKYVVGDIEHRSCRQRGFLTSIYVKCEVKQQMIPT